MISWQWLKERRIIKVATLYAVVGWAVMQVADTISDPLHLPIWMLTFIVVIVLLGFPITLVLAWTTEKIHLEKPIVEDLIPRKIIAEKSIAVLPFLNMNKDASHEYFADGITENILTQLASIENLKVISRTSIMRYKNTLKTIPEIAQDLGVKYILEGSAQAQGDKVRINVQLIEAADDRHLWAKAFDEDLRDIFSIQNLVASEVVSQLRASIQPREREQLDTIPTQNTEAYDLFLKGMHAYSVYVFIPGGWKQAEAFFLKAIEKDPKFKQAYLYLSRVYGFSISWLGELSPEEGFQKTQKYLHESMKYGVAAHDYLTMSQLEILINKDFKKGLELAKHALQMSPNDSDIRFLYSYWLSTAGRFDEALKMVEDAVKLDPVSVSAFNYRGIPLYLMGRYGEAIDVFRESIRLHPLSLRQYDHLSKIYLTIKQYGDAIDVLNSGFVLSSYRPPSMVAYLATACYYLGEEEKSAKLIKELILRNENEEKGTAVFIAQYFAETQDITSALLWLEKSVSLNDVELFWLKEEPLFRNIRKETVFRNVMMKFGFDTM